MEKEIKVRKKRFTAFWTAVLLLCAMALPMAAYATDYIYNDSGTPNDIAQQGDTISIPGEFTVIYDDAAPITVAAGQSHTVQSCEEERTGMTFSGWKVTSVYLSSGSVGSVTLQSQWAPRQYTIHYELNGGTNNGANPDTYTYGTGVTALAAASKEGHTFAGWCSDIALENPITAIEADRTGEVTLYAKFTVNTYSITVDFADGSTPSVITQEYGTPVTEPSVPEREHQVFTGWDKTFPTQMPGENITITAQWAPKQYSIRYELNGGTNGANPESYAYGTGVTGFADAEKENHTFAGWYADSTLQTPVTAIEPDQSGEMTLYAKFDPLYTLIGAGTHTLTAGVMYKLDSGVTQVSSDSSVYTSGSIFYVSADGSYTFS